MTLPLRLSRVVSAASLAAFAAASFAAAGCTSDPGAPDAGDGGMGSAQVELGTGAAGFEPLVAEQPLELVAGPQGGFHFIVHARARGIDPGDPAAPGQPINPRTTFSAFAEDGRQIDRLLPSYHLGYEASAAGAGWYELSSGRILQIENAEVPDAFGQRVRVVVRVRDAAGHEGQDERWVVPFDARLDAGPDTPDAGADGGTDAPAGPDGG